MAKTQRMRSKRENTKRHRRNAGREQFYQATVDLLEGLKETGRTLTNKQNAALSRAYNHLGL